MEFKGHYWQQSGFDDRYKFNDIERIKDLDIGLDLAMFRGHDPVTGRWLQPDPMSEMAFGWTPYRFGFNNPVSVTDPLGLFESWDDARAFALISRMGNFSIERMGRYWSVWNYDLDATYSIVNGEFQVSRLLDLDITITGAGKPKTNPVPEGMRSFESLGGMPASSGGGDEFNCTQGISAFSSLLGIGTSGFKEYNVSKGKFRGSSGSYYYIKNRQGWNQFTGTKEYMSNTISKAKLAGRITRGLGLLNYGITTNEYLDGNINNAAYGIEMTSTTIGTFAPAIIAIPWTIGYEVFGRYGIAQLSWYQNSFKPWVRKKLGVE